MAGPYDVVAGDVTYPNEFLARACRVNEIDPIARDVQGSRQRREDLVARRAPDRAGAHTHHETTVVRPADGFVSRTGVYVDAESEVPVVHVRRVVLLG